MSQKLSRRELLRLGLGTTLGTTLAAPLLSGLAAGDSANGAAANGAPVGSKAQAVTPDKPALPMRVLGQTGQRVTVFGLGGASSKTPLSNGPHDQAVAIVNRALDLGVNYFDTATTYGDGKSETALGEVAHMRRKEMFLATKTDARDYDGAMRELEASLKRLKTDHLDLWQMHHVSFAERDTTPAFAANGAIKAIEKAKAEKVIQFAGVTGHHRTDVLADWLRRHPFDTLLAAINAADVHQPDSFIRNLLPVARERKAGVIAMKVPAYGALLNRDAGVTMRDAMHYALSQEGVACCIIACDSIAMLEENVAAAKAFKRPLSRQAQADIEAKTSTYWQRAAFYRRWT